MDLTQFLIMVAPILVLVGCIVAVFLWASYGKIPDFVEESQVKENEGSNKEAANL